MAKVVTYMARSGASIDVTPRQEKAFDSAGYWPRSDRGEEYCQVSHGLHAGAPTWTDDEVAALIHLTRAEAREALFSAPTEPEE